MLVGALQHQVGADLAEARLGYEGVGATAVEPHVQDVLDGLPVGWVMVGAEEGGVVGGEPGVRAVGGKGLEDALVDDRVLQPLAGAAVEIEGDRHAPGALAADHPVGAVFHHRADAVDRAGGEPTNGVDGGQRAVAQRVLSPPFQSNGSVSAPR